MTEFARFGTPMVFELAVRWTTDSEPLSRRPAGYGWSMGDLRITVGGHVVTAHRRSEAGEPQKHVGWYLLPVFDWLADHWAHLLHEEDFSWTEKSSAPAVAACRRALDRWIGETDEVGQKTYTAVQAWAERHALRTAAAGGLFPDLFIRRLLDEIELSWSAVRPSFAPDGFAFVTEPGTARLPVADVAGPLWEALAWAVSTAPAEDQADRATVRALEQKIETIRDLPLSRFAAVYVPSSTVLTSARAALARLGASRLLDDTRARTPARALPAVDTFSPAVAMFGGVSPDLGESDVETIAQLLADRMSAREEPALGDLVRPRTDSGLGVPHSDGQAFAVELLEDLGEPGAASFVDIRAIVERLGIEIRERRLATDTIRGVALAGDGFGPAILINTTNLYNSSEEGRRFTLAHELCHIIFDRSRARRVSIASGPWVAPGIEKRANAFAAALLMPGFLVRRLLPDGRRIERDDIVRAAATLHVSESALVEHIYNLDLVGDLDRERLRRAFRS